MWGEIKTAINSTTGAGMMPLDKIIEESNEQIFYNLMADKYGVEANATGVWVLPRTKEINSSVPANIKGIYFSPETKVIRGIMTSGNWRIKELYIPMVSHIENNCFKGCEELKTVVLGSSLKKIESVSFYAPGLTVFFKGTKSQWDSVERGQPWNFGGTSLIVCYDQTFIE